MTPLMIIAAIAGAIMLFALGLLAGCHLGARGKIDRQDHERQLAAQECQAQRMLELSRNDAESKLRMFQETISERFQNVEGHFREIAAAVLEQRRQELSSANGEQLSSLLQPFRERLEIFSRQVGQLREASIESGRQLRGEITALNDSSRRIGNETGRLASALSVGGKFQGLFGEKTLARLLDKSGLKENEDFFLQQTIRDDQGRSPSSSTLIPDAVVRLPERNVMLIIDSKASFPEYLESCRQELDDAARKKALKAHVSNIRRHIHELADKDYASNWRRANSNDAVECVMMFVPNEAALQAALEAAPELWSEAYHLGVVIAGPANFIVAMKMVEIVWQRVTLNEQAGEILEDAQKLLNAVGKFREELGAVGQRLQQCRDAYDKATRALGGEEGKTGIAGIARHMIELRAGLNGKKG